MSQKSNTSSSSVVSSSMKSHKKQHLSEQIPEPVKSQDNIKPDMVAEKSQSLNTSQKDLKELETKQVASQQQPLIYKQAIPEEKRTIYLSHFSKVFNSSQNEKQVLDICKDHCTVQRITIKSSPSNYPFAFVVISQEDDIDKVIKELHCKKIDSNHILRAEIKSQRKPFIKRQFNNDRKQIECYICHQYGHKSYDCPNKPENKRNQEPKRQRSRKIDMKNQSKGQPKSKRYEEVDQKNHKRKRQISEDHHRRKRQDSSDRHKKRRRSSSSEHGKKHKSNKKNVYHSRSRNGKKDQRRKRYNTISSDQSESDSYSSYSSSSRSSSIDRRRRQAKRNDKKQSRHHHRKHRKQYSSSSSD